MDIHALIANLMRGVIRVGFGGRNLVAVDQELVGAQVQSVLFFKHLSEADKFAVIAPVGDPIRWRQANDEEGNPDPLNACESHAS